jgi:hypothetical protein
MRNGDAFYTCDHKVGAFATRRKCGQHFYVLCTERLCSVFRITREQYDRFADGHHAPAEILAELGAELREAA